MQGELLIRTQECDREPSLVEKWTPKLHPCHPSVKLMLKLLIHSKLCSITPVATKVHVILWSFLVLTWMRDTSELVWHVTLWNNKKKDVRTI